MTTTAEETKESTGTQATTGQVAGVALRYVVYLVGVEEPQLVGDERTVGDLLALLRDARAAGKKKGGDTLVLLGTALVDADEVRMVALDVRDEEEDLDDEEEDEEDEDGRRVVPAPTRGGLKTL